MRAAEPPNVLWFIVDDMSPHFACYGEKLVQTPHVDGLAREGTRFAHAYTTAPVCSPSRSAFIAGMYQTSIRAHHHRSGRGVQKIDLPCDVVPVPALLKKAGYFTCIGDGLPEVSGGEAAQPGNAGPRKADYNFEWDRAMYDSSDWADRKADQPFFMQVQLPGGKLRGDREASFQKTAAEAREKLGSAIDPATVTLPPYYPRDSVLLQDWAAYLDSVRLTDHHVGQVISRLEREGLLENTLVLFATDHGISHARGKQFLYDEGTHIPFVARGPGVPRGSVREDLIELMDVAAISLAAAGVPLPPTMQAKNIFARDYAPREAAYGARDRCDETVDHSRSVRTGHYLYIRNFLPQRPLLQPSVYKDNKAIVQTLRRLHASGQLDDLQEKLLFSPTRPAEELYDWRADPHQLKNLADDPAHRTALEAHRAQLERWMIDTKDAGAEPAAMYESDMAVYLKNTADRPSRHDELKANIALMRRWMSEGK
jgi:arylsulfatase A-like enzyme